MEERKAILIADDMEINRVILRGLFCADYEVLEAGNGKEAMEILRRRCDDIVICLLDIIMPEKNGYSVLQDLQNSNLIKKVPVIVISTIDEVEDEVRALELGAVDFITKPFDLHVVKKRVQNVIDSYKYRYYLETKVKAQKWYIEKLYKSLDEILNRILGNYDLVAVYHVLRVSRCAKIMLEKLALQYSFNNNLSARKIELMSIAALLHDIGMIKMGGLSANAGEPPPEAHCESGCNILKEFEQYGQNEFLRYAYNICRYHHERWDGGGYPDGLSGDNIPLCAQVVGMLAEYDRFVFFHNVSPQQALENITKQSGGAFSPMLCGCLADMYHEFAEAVVKETDLSVNEARNKISQQLMHVLRNGMLDEPDNRKYYPLFKYLGATIFQIDVLTGKYERVYAGLTEFLSLEQCGQINGALANFLRRNVKDDDRVNIIKWINDAIDIYNKFGKLSVDKRYQFLNERTGGYEWYKVSIVGSNIYMESSNTLLLIFKNIASEVSLETDLLNCKTGNLEGHLNRYRQENQKLKIQAQVDQLTGLYNKMTTQEAVKQVLLEKSGQRHGLFVIDLDNFKAINDTLGHLQGDRTLQEFARIIKSQFRNADIVGRIGGDEFLVLLVDIPDYNFLKVRADRLVESMRYLENMHDQKVVVSGSVGIAVYAHDGGNFEELYEKADMALYMAKRYGKNQWKSYADILDCQSMMENNDRRLLGIKMNIDNEDRLFNSSIYNVIYEYENLAEGINAIIDKTARRYSLDDVYIIDTEESEILFKWRAEVNAYSSVDGVEADDQLRAGLLRKINEAVIWVCNDTSELPAVEAKFFRSINISAIIAVPLYFGHRTGGVVTFLSRGGQREWLQREIDVCRHISRIVSIIIYEKKLNVELERSRQINAIMLQCIDYESYVVDESFNIIMINGCYVNKEGLSRNKCYRTIRHNDEPCGDCILKKLNRSVNKAVIEINNCKGMFKIMAHSFVGRDNKIVYIIIKEAVAGK